MFRRVSFIINFSEPIVIDALVLPAWISSLIKSEAPERFFVFSAGPVIMLLGKFRVGIVFDELEDHHFDSEVVLDSDDLMFLCVVNTTFQKRWQKLLDDVI